MITRYFDGEVPYPAVAASRTEGDKAIADLAQQTIADFNTQFEQFQFSRALETTWTLVGAVNKYIVENEPWAVAEKDDKDSRARLATVLYTSGEALRIITALVYPVIPDSAAKLWQQLGLGEIKQQDLRQLKWGQLQLGTRLGKVEAVFPRADKSAVERMQQMELQRSTESGSREESQEKTQGPSDKKAPEMTAGAGTQAGEPATEADAGASTEVRAVAMPPSLAGTSGTAPVATQAAAPTGGDNRISIDDFLKVELRVGQVKVAEKVKGADKLLRLEVDIGTEVRQIVAGIAKAYDPEALVGRKVVIVANLQPRKLRGLESQGMIVAASLGDEGQPVLAGFLEDVPVGAKLK
jgi:methionyl-tRNA synthetase